MNYTQDQLFEIQYAMLSEPGDALAGLLHQALGPRNAIEQVLSGVAERTWQELLQKLGAEEYISFLPQTIERFQLRIAQLDPERAIQKQIALGGKILILSEHPEIRSLYSTLGLHAPTVLWVKGNTEALLSPAISIVGTRNATRSGIAITHQLVKGICNKFAVVSGGARGIDTAAHSAALALNTPTIAYMAGGLLNLYPSENVEMFSDISRNGLMVSECAPEVAPTKWRFLQRNRLIAAHGRATVVIEAAQRSGARNTAGHAFGCGKEVFAFPGPQSSEQHRGCNLLIRDGIARGVNDVWELAGMLLGNHQAFKHTGFSSDETRVMDSLSRHPRTLERICLESGMSKNDASRSLRQLALHHIAFSTPRGWMLS